MSRLVFFCALAVTTLACEPAKGPSTDGGDAAVVDAGQVAAASASMTVVSVKATSADAGLDAGKK
jgi:hypothetical protein